MLIVSELKRNLEKAVKGLQKRGIEDAEKVLNQIISLDDDRKRIQGELDNVLSQSNKAAKEIGKLIGQGKKEEAEKAKEETSRLKSASKDLAQKMTDIEKELQNALYNVPNIPNEIVPAGKSDEDNEVVKDFEIEGLPKLVDGAKPHWDLVSEYDIIDFELGNKVSGSGFPFYKGQGARLSRALINYFLDEGIKKGYQEIQPPIVINEDSGYGTGQLPEKEGQMYGINDTNLYLIPTAEVPITNIYRGEILDESRLPVKNIGFTPCFRREAGSWGAHVRGLNRLHQFDKVEIVCISKIEESYDLLEEMKSHVENLLKSLELPYRILRLCAGDLGFTSAITYDFEVYSMAQKKWLEVSSVSNFENYQSNRLRLRYKTGDKKKVLAHTLNGSALALPRIIAAILENNQQDNSIRIPEVLRRYCGFEEITK